MLTLLVTMAAIAGIIYIFSKNAMITEAENRYHGFMALTNKTMDNVLSVVEMAASSKLVEVEDDLDRPDRMTAILSDMVQKNPYIVGCGLAFEPNYYPHRGKWFELYALRHSIGEIRTSQIGGPDHDYLPAEWYMQGKQHEEGYWTDPYLDNAGGKTMLFTYSLPIHDAGGRVVGVLGADISLDWLNSQLMEIDMKNNNLSSPSQMDRANKNLCYSFIIGQGGSYIVRPYWQHDTLSGRSTEVHDMLDARLIQSMLEGYEGHVELNINKTPSFLFYAPLERAGWSMAIVVPHHTFYHRADIVGGVILALMALGLLVGFLVCRILIRHATEPLSRFAESAGEIAQGRFDTPLPVITTDDEIGVLRDSFEGMQQSLARYVEDLKRTTATQASMESELKIASEIQRAMLPKEYPPYPDRTDIDIYGQLTPAKTVGGDLYDFYMRDEKLFFCIGDVSGKGVPSALVMAVTRFLFRNISSALDSPDGIVTAINEALVDGNESNMFVTLFVGVLDLTTGSLLYCNAGRSAPMLIGKGIGFLVCDTNIPVGLQSGWKFTLQEVSILKQTTIFLYTDGLSEAEDMNHRQFDTPRIRKVLSRLLEQKRHQPQTLIQEMTDAVSAFVGDVEQYDDMTMLAVQYTRKPDLRYQLAITLANDVQQVTQLESFINAVCLKAGLHDTLTMQLNLAIEEAVVNIMNYAYPSGTKGEIRIEAQLFSDTLRFTISDSGVAFDPTAKGAVDTSLGTNERGIGGLGIHLVRKLMDTVEYERHGNLNVLVLTKNLTNP